MLTVDVVVQFLHVWPLVQYINIRPGIGDLVHLEALRDLFFKKPTIDALFKYSSA
jgi:hypothetical protein